jgi:hypothetical protein
MLPSSFSKKWCVCVHACMRACVRACALALGIPGTGAHQRARVEAGGEDHLFGVG